MQFTIITTTHAVTVEGERWTRDATGNVFVYDDTADNADPVAEVDSDSFEAIATGDVDITDLSALDVDDITRAVSKHLADVSAGI